MSKIRKLENQKQKYDNRNKLMNSVEINLNGVGVTLYFSSITIFHAY